MGAFLKTVEDGSQINGVFYSVSAGTRSGRGRL